MSLRCSLLGHSYGETEIEREREEQGSEVVVTVREFEECERCGERKVLTENKEVTALQSPAPDLESAATDGETDAGAGPTAGTGGRTGPDAGAASGATAGAGVATDSELGAAPGEDDAEIMTDSTDDAEPTASPETGPSASPSESDAGTETHGEEPSSRGEVASAKGETETDFEDAQSADDDAVILDDEESTPEDRTPGEWPEAETTHPAEADDGPGDWPAVGREDGGEGYDAEPGDAEGADVEFAGGLAPEAAPGVDDETDEVEFVNADGDALQAKDTGGETELSSGISAGSDAPSLSGPADDPAVDAEFVCPECEYREDVSGSSLRAGDICPECARGYLAQE